MIFKSACEFTNNVGISVFMMVTFQCQILYLVD